MSDIVRDQDVRAILAAIIQSNPEKRGDVNGNLKLCDEYVKGLEERRGGGRAYGENVRVRR